MDVRLPDGTLIQGVPDGMSKSDLTAKLKANGHDVSGFESKAPASAASRIPGSNVQAPAPDAAPAPDSNKDSWLSKLGGVAEVPLTMASSMVGMTAGSLAGLVKGVTGGKYGTQEGVREGQKTAEEVGQALSYQPRTQTGQQLTQGLGGLMNDSGIAGIAPMTGELAALGRAAAPAKNALADMLKSGTASTADAAIASKNSLASLLNPKPMQSAMRGGGAALTEESTLRTQRAADLPVPIKLTKGQSSRSFEQQQFERETAKLPEGEPLRARFAEQNKQMIDNFDSFMDGTGAQQTSLRGAGESVVGAVSAKRASVKAKINSVYINAREAGDMAELVDVSPIRAYVEQNRSAMKNAPVLAAVDDELNRLTKGGSSLSINDMEELRKMTGRLSQPGTPNVVYGGDVKGLIDSATREKGGPQYQQARRLYENYANEFKDKAVIDKLLRDKPGTKDRAVAYEDVFNHSIMQGSLDDVRSMRRTLQTAGDDGAQAWRELQGQTISHIKETITSNSARDVQGNPIVSPDKLNKLVRGLDADGKLDFIFGKKGAERIRDVNDLAKDVYTAPPGSVNSSNTATALLAALDLSSSAFTGLPLPIATTLNYGVKRIKSNALQKKVTNALADSLNPP